MTDMATAALPIDLGCGPFAVTTRGLAKRFGSVRALDGLDLQVPEGAVYVLVGPNGAGKSTLIRTLMGLVRYQAGAVNVLGRDPADRGAEVRAGIGYVPEDYRVGYAWMTVGRLLTGGCCATGRTFPKAGGAPRSWGAGWSSAAAQPARSNGRCGATVTPLRAACHRPVRRFVRSPPCRWTKPRWHYSREGGDHDGLHGRPRTRDEGGVDRAASCGRAGHPPRGRPGSRGAGARLAGPGRLQQNAGSASNSRSRGGG